MSDVIRFPQFIKSRSHSVSELNEAQVAREDVKMSDLYGGPEEVEASDKSTEANISFLQQTGEFAAPVAGWSNQELADLYRTQRILALAGVTTEVDRGITDEGDPWFVFMDSQGDVLVHFSRFDGTYLVSSHLQEAPIKGKSLQDLVTQFSRRVQPVKSPGQSAPNVVSLAKRSRDVVFIHPAAALAALVWSVYLMADELIAATPMIAAGEAEGSGHAHAPLEEVSVTKLEEHTEASSTLASASQKAQPIASDLEGAKQAMALSSNRENVAPGIASYSAKAVGVSLSLVALAVGLPLPASNAVEIIDIEDSAKNLSLESLSAALAQVKAKEKALLLASEPTELEQREIDAQAQPIEKELVAALTIDPEAEASAVVQLAEPIHIADTSNLSIHTSVGTPAVTPRNETPVKKEEAAKVIEEEAPNTVTITTKEVSFLQSFDAAFESFEIISLERITQNDLIQLLSAESSIEFPGPQAPSEDAYRYEAFDQDANIYLEFLLQTYTDVRIVDQPTEIIFIHMDAADKNGSAPELYTKSWSFDNGKMISIIGLKSDMIEFDLIA